MPTQKIIGWIFMAGFAACILQIWLPEYFLTGDGPCHLYNASVLHDLWSHSNETFYRRFYQVVYQPNPNWLSHLLLSIPLYLASGPVTEKMFISFYAALMLTGNFMLLNKVSGKASYWSIGLFILVFNHPLAKGFYNFTLATAFYTWMVFSWIKFLENRSNKRAIIFFLFTALTFFTQLLPVVLGLLTCAFLSVSFAYAPEEGIRKKPALVLMKSLATLAVLSAPFLFLMGWFITKENGLRLTLQHHFYRFTELVQLKYFISLTSDEAYFTAISGIIIFALTVYALTMRFRLQKTIHKYDGLLLTLAIFMFIYLFFPESFMGRVILMSMRMQLFLVIVAFGCIAYLLPPTIKNAPGVILFLCFIGLCAIRIPIRVKASQACAEYNSVAGYIKPYSVVLPLDFAPAGLDDNGKAISNRNFLFSHALHYTGAAKPLIMLDNYEALAGYFPLLWTYDTNPYVHLSRDAGIEAQPPSADIEAYRRSAGVSIDYIVMWCFDSSFLAKGHYRKLDSQIHAGYHLVYTSRGKRALLYERNP